MWGKANVLGVWHPPPGSNLFPPRTPWVVAETLEKFKRGSRNPIYTSYLWDTTAENSDFRPVSANSGGGE
jgi:hypothetical protein